MILYFLVSIINSMAQSHLKQRHHQSAEKRKNGGVALKSADSSSSKATPVLAADSKSAKKD